MLSVTSCFSLSSPSPPTEGLLVLWLKTYHSLCLGCRGRGDSFVSAERQSNIYSYCKSKLVKKKKKKPKRVCVCVFLLFPHEHQPTGIFIFCVCTSRTLLWLLLSLYFTGLIFMMGSLPCFFFKLVSFQIPYKNFEQVGKNFIDLL